MINGVSAASFSPKLQTLGEVAWKQSGKEGPYVPDQAPSVKGHWRSLESATNMLEGKRAGMEGKRGSFMAMQKEVAEFPEKLAELRANGSSSSAIAEQEALVETAKTSLADWTARWSATEAYGQAKIDFYANLVNTLTERESTTA